MKKYLTMGLVALFFVMGFVETVFAVAQSGSPAFTGGTPAKYGTLMTVGPGTLGVTTNLTYIWYRSADNGVGDDTLLSAGTTYTPVAADIGNYLIVTATTTDATGTTPYIVTTATTSKVQLTISGTTLTSHTKEYDGNNSIIVAASGTPITFVYGDEATVKVAVTATYDTSATGTGKTIAVSYALVGDGSSNYLAPAASSSFATDGVISPKQLTIAAPTITLSKVYDGNNVATVTAGALSGKIGSETVTINTAVATYDTILVGINKTITVAYTITGVNSGNYFAPASSSVSNGVIINTRRNLYTDNSIARNVDITSNELAATTSQSITETAQTVVLSLITPSGNVVSVPTTPGTTNTQAVHIGTIIKRQLKFGITGVDITALQALLAKDTTIYPEGLVTGYFGNLTKKAIQKFQEKYGIAKKGVAGYGEVGPKTKAKLIELFGN